MIFEDEVRMREDRKKHKGRRKTKFAEGEIGIDVIDSNNHHKLNTGRGKTKSINPQKTKEYKAK